MRFSQEIYNLLGGADAARVQYSVVDGRGGYFQNVRRILSFSDEVIVFCGKRGTVRVEGRGLTLGKYGAGDAEVRGDILRVLRGEDGNAT